MKKSIIILCTVLSSQLCSAGSLILSADMDPREIVLPSGYKLWSQSQAEQIDNRPMRDDVLNYSTLYLENRISNSDFLNFLKSWAEKGFNFQERIILTDTLKKSNMTSTLKDQWLCRIEAERNCAKTKIFPKHLSPILQKYDWLVIDGQIFPRMAWDEISLPNESLTWIFLSSRFETYTFQGKGEELKFRNPILKNWVTGTCDNFTVHPEIQSLENNVLVNRNCLKSSLAKPLIEPSFYEKNKNSIWIAAGLVIGVGAFNSFSGKKIVLEKPSFR